MVSPDKNAKNITVSETSSANHTSTTHLNPTRGLAASHAPELWGRCFTSTSFAPHLFLLGWLKLNLALLLDQLRLA